MTSQEIMQKAIRKALDNGWPSDTPEVRGNGVYWVGAVTEVREDFATVIFNHDFAKALWGEDELPLEPGSYTIVGSPRTAWKHHLKRMVIADNPIQYLGENL